MEVMEAIRSRRSIRRYKGDAIEEEKLKVVLEAARLAPSAGNKQPWKFIVVDDETIKQELVGAAYNQRFIGEAAVVIVACGLPTGGQVGGFMSSVSVDVAIAVDHLTLVAAAEGLGTCWIGAFKEVEVKKILGIPEEVHVYALTPLGYPAEVPSPTWRKPLAGIVCYNKWK